MATGDASVRTFGSWTVDPGDQVSDARLVEEMIGGSQDALAALYDRHGKAVFAAALRAGRDPSIAAEVVQETFLTLWNRAELFDATRGSLPGWLRTIARNRAVDHLRAGSRQGRALAFSSLGPDGADQHAVDEWLTASGELVGMAAVEPGPEAALASKEARSSIEEALASLGPMERSVITLAYQGGLSQSEIADRLGWPLGTVKTRTRRALGQLRERLEQQQGGGHERGTTASIGPSLSGRGSLKAVAVACHPDPHV